MDTGTNVTNGTVCGTNLVCYGGTCSACTAGVSCTPTNPCHTGQTSCSTGQSVCVDTGTNVTNGTVCGTNLVCYGGTCSACTAGVSCTPTNPCHTGQTSCSTGQSVCVDTGTNVSNGTVCGTNLVCYGGTCTSCTAGVSCTPAEACHVGLTDCSSGQLYCEDQGTNVSNGTACGSNLVCYGGSCVSCEAGVSCTPTNPCHAGLTSCGTGQSVCLDQGTNLADGTSCGTNMVCNGGQCSPGVTNNPSCAGMGDTCNDGGLTVSCCNRKLVPGGTFPMGRSLSGTDAYAAGDSDELPEHDATVAGFYLDTFEVTVGRFRKFVDQYNGTPPVEGAGAHPLISGSGWQAAWNVSLPSTQAALISDLKCYSSYQTWTDTPGSNETYPINCVTWYEAFAFCAWDGGRLPTEAEWEYASAGGAENRLNPWGQQAPDNTLAVFNCQWGGTPGTCTASDRAPVGSVPAGQGRWGHHDLAGSVWEWALDWYSSSWYSGAGNPCENCANLTSSSTRVRRGGSWSDSTPPRVAFRYGHSPTQPYNGLGFRCARAATQPRILFTSNAYPRKIMSMAPDGTDIVEVCEPNSTLSAHSAHWNADMTKLTGGIRTAAGKDEVWVANADGSSYVQSNFNDQYGTLEGFFRTPTTIWLSRAYATGRTELFEVPLTLASSTMLTNFGASNTSADGFHFVSPTSKVCYRKQQSSNSPTGRAYCMNSDLTGEVQVSTINPHNVVRVSPDGTKVALGTSGGAGIHVASTSGPAGQTTLTSIGQYPIWSPDGTKIAFSHYDGAQQDVYVMNADGTGVTNVTNTPSASELASDWR